MTNALVENNASMFVFQQVHELKVLRTIANVLLTNEHEILFATEKLVIKSYRLYVNGVSKQRSKNYRGLFMYLYNICTEYRRTSDNSLIPPCP